MMQRFLLTTFLAVLINICDGAGNAIPPEASQINTWFSSTIKPISARQSSVDPSLAEAETDPPTIIKVRQDGSGEFKTISDAVKHVKVGNTKRVIIDIGKGEYIEKVTIERFKSYITFLGDPQNKPTLTFTGTAAEYGTVDSATLIIEADYFVAANIIISNSAPRPDGKRKGAQAAAIRISGDKSAFYNCRFIGFQDTICDDKGNHFFKDSYIEGTIDFIFGEARSLYLNTELHVIPGDPEAMITAHARKNVDGVGGYSFVHCSITGTGQTAFLGRAWMEAARVIYSYCTMSDVVKPEGWSDYQKPTEMLYFAEYNNKGPGAALTARAPFTKKLTAAEAEEFTSLDYIEGTKWLLPPPTIKA